MINNSIFILEQIIYTYTVYMSRFLNYIYLCNCPRKVLINLQSTQIEIIFFIFFLPKLENSYSTSGTKYF